jgi:hypothetical protein
MIHRHATGERVARIDNPSGQIEAIAVGAPFRGQKCGVSGWTSAPSLEIAVLLEIGLPGMEFSVTTIALSLGGSVVITTSSPTNSAPLSPA